MFFRQRTGMQESPLVSSVVSSVRQNTQCIAFLVLGHLSSARMSAEGYRHIPSLHYKGEGG